MSPSSAPPPSLSHKPRSGAISTPTGDLHIPSSTRADGSLRKEIKIRPGYRPPEDVEVYKNRTAEAWKTRGTGGVPGAEDYNHLDTSRDRTGAGAANVTPAKNTKRREARKRARASGADAKEECVTTVNGSALKVAEWNQFSKEVSSKEISRSDAPSVAEAEKEKQARNLKKKLRQARELREKKDQGENLLPEQFEKVIRIHELIRQLDSLGFDSDGARKP